MLNFIRIMKIIKINDNIKINIEDIYSLEKHNNQNEINEWNNKYDKYLTSFYKDPPLLPITDKEVFKPVYGEEIDKDKMKLYADALSNHILTIIGEPPVFKEIYFIILSTGIKINIDKTIYDIIDKHLEKYIEKEI